MRIRLYHGTTENKLDKIRKNGLNTPYLTNKKALAKYYANETSEKDNSKAVILEVYVDENNLVIDKNSLNEPVSVGNKTIEVMENEVDNIMNKYDYNTISDIPKNQYQISLFTVYSCRCTTVITRFKVLNM